MRNVAISVSECLFVYLSVCLLAYLENHASKFHLIFCTCYLWPWHLNVMYFCMVLWVTSCFRIMDRIAKIKYDVHALSSSPAGETSQPSDNVVWSRSLGGGTGGEICRLRLYIFFYTECTSLILPLIRKFYGVDAIKCFLLL